MKKYPCPAGVEYDCGYPACAHALQCETSVKTKKLLEKLDLIRSGNTAILPTGEIVPRGTEGSMNYECKDEVNNQRETD